MPLRYHFCRDLLTPLVLENRGRVTGDPFAPVIDEQDLRKDTQIITLYPILHLPIAIELKDS